MSKKYQTNDGRESDETRENRKKTILWKMFLN